MVQYGGDIQKNEFQKIVARVEEKKGQLEINPNLIGHINKKSSFKKIHTNTTTKKDAPSKLYNFFPDPSNNNLIRGLLQKKPKLLRKQFIICLPNQLRVRQNRDKSFPPAFRVQQDTNPNQNQNKM